MTLHLHDLGSKRILTFCILSASLASPLPALLRRFISINSSSARSHALAPNKLGWGSNESEKGTVMEDVEDRK